MVMLFCPLYPSENLRTNLLFIIIKYCLVFCQIFYINVFWPTIICLSATSHQFSWILIITVNTAYKAQASNCSIKCRIPIYRQVCVYNKCILSAYLFLEILWFHAAHSDYLLFPYLDFIATRSYTILFIFY